ncbi:MAG: PLDc N-terminal domain-containing protein [Eubacterium sp.]|nr:PLDc N-terminal domain-containing protein [Eubacterium sp.]
MPDISEMLPFLIPLVVAQLALLGYTIYHIMTHKNYKRGSRGLWIAVVLIGMQFVGPILYFLLGKEDA